jgi:hypothetical protein
MADTIPPDPPLLEADVARQASDQLRGYGYQVWRSVEAWLNLQQSEVLALEIAEDFDVVCDRTATTTQVKDVAHSMTLRSPEVIAAIGNFWEHRCRNPGRQLRFRFLTTAPAGVEQGDPFGPGVPGLEAWTLAARSGQGVGRLRQFLMQQNLAEPVKAFLNKADESEIWTALLQPLQWALEQGPADYVEETVRSKLIELGHQRHIAAHDSEAVAATLFKTVFDVASSKGKRVLHRSDLIRIFDEKTTRRISPAETLAAATAIGYVLVPGGTALPISAPTYRLVSGPPPAPPQLARRQSLVVRLSAVLAETGRLILTGSTGMGKSYLARLLVSDDWLWADLRWEKPVNRMILQELAAQVDATSNLPGVVFDDYWPDGVDEIPFGALAYRLQERGIPFIVTTSYALPARVVANLGVPPPCWVSVPGLTPEETQDLLGACGCPADQAPILVPALVAVTSGHPQLVHARIRDLAAKGWKEIRLEELLAKPRTLEEVETEARGSLRQLLQERTRTLAYRLSLLAQPFRRDQALAVGAIAPAVELPGESFELLSGPWIERLSGDYFTVSPLLQGAAREIWPPDQVAALHRALAKILVKTPPLTQIEAAGSFTHAYLGQDSRLLLQLVLSLLHADDAVQQVVFPSLRWFSLICNDVPLPGFVAPADGLVLRAVQYRIAGRSESRLKIAARWDQESQVLAATAGADPMYRLQFAVTMVMDYETRHPIAQRLEWVREAAAAFAEVGHRHPDFELGPLPVGPGRTETTVDTAASLFAFVLASCTGIDDLADLAASLSSLDESFRSRLLAVFDMLPGGAASLLDRCWIKQVDLPEPNWPRCLQVLAGFEGDAELWQREDLREAAVRAQSTILHGSLHDTEAALSLLRCARRGATSAILEDQEASLMQDRNDHRAAWAIWQRGLPRWSAEGDSGEIFLSYAAKKAAISAGRLGEWAEAARLFLDASTRLDSFQRSSGAAPEGNLELLLVPTALLAEHAYCSWRAGERQSSIAAFATAISGLENLGTQVADLDEYKVTARLLGHVLLWLHEPAGWAEAPPGIISSPQVTPEVLNLPAMGIEQLWALLCQLESDAGGDAQLLKRMRQRLSRSQEPTVGSLLGKTEIRLALRDGQGAGLVPILAAFCHAAVIGEGHAACVLQGLFFALLFWAHSRSDAAPPWAQWRADLEAAFPDEAAMVDGWLATAQEVRSLSPYEVRSALRRQPGSQRAPFLAMRVATEEGSSAEAVYHAQVILVTSFPHQGMFFGDVVAAVVEKGWRRLLENPASLVAPRLNVPSIRRAMEDVSHGISRAAAILLAAESALHVRLDDLTRRLLGALRDTARITRTGLHATPGPPQSPPAVG